MSGTKFIDRGKYKLLPGNGGLRMRNKAVLDTQNYEGECTADEENSGLRILWITLILSVT